MSELTCPKCQSENTQKLSAIVASGTSQSQSVSVGSYGGTVGGAAQFGTTSSTTNTTTQSVLAKKLSAPAKKKTILVLVGFGFLALIALGMFSSKLLGIPVAAGVGYWGFMIYTKNVAYNATVWPGLFEEWSQSFYCHRCENIFKL
jgi:hypothetical protein